MPTIRLSKSIIDGLPVAPKDTVFWDENMPGFGVKVTPRGRKVFVAIYRTGGAGSRLRKYTIGPYGRVTLHGARSEAQKVFAAKLEGRDPATEKREGKRRLTIDKVEDIIDLFDRQRLTANRSRKEVRQLLDRMVVSAWRGRSVHEINKRDVIALIGEVERRGTPYAANKLTKVVRTFFNWCVGRGILDHSPAQGITLPCKEVARDRTLADEELASILLAARNIGGPFGGIVELLALTGQRREEVAQMTWSELDLRTGTWTLPGSRAKNGKAHIVHLSDSAIRLLEEMPRVSRFVFTVTGERPFQGFSQAKRQIDGLSGITNWRIHDLRRTAVSGMARLGVPPHVADRILNHVGGTIGGVAAVYQRHEFMAERKVALDLWDKHVSGLLDATAEENAT